MRCIPQDGMQRPAQGKHETASAQSHAPEHCKVYDRYTNQWYTIPPDQYADNERFVGALHKRQQRNQSCNCPRSKWWYCNAICDDCKYHIPDEVSLDAMTADDLPLLSRLPAPDASPEDIAAARLMLVAVIEYMRQLDPEADKIIACLAEDPEMSLSGIARLLGRSPRTFVAQMQRYRMALRERFGSP